MQSAARATLPEGAWLLNERLAIAIYLFPDGALLGDIDNRVKPVLDALNRCVYVDDRLVERLIVQKFEAAHPAFFRNPSAVLAHALDSKKPLLYVKISREFHEDQY